MRLRQAIEALEMLENQLREHGVIDDEYEEIDILPHEIILKRNGKIFLHVNTEALTTKPEPE